MTDSLTLLAIAPHPDDAELFCGGVLALAAAAGHATGVLDLTAGELSTRGTPELRATETAAASQALGLAHRENLHLPDGALSPWDGAEAERTRSTPVARLVEALRRLRPELVLVPWARERHPDHEAASALATRALFFAGVRRFETDPPQAPHAPRQVLYYPMRELAEPSLVVDVTAVHARKMAAVRCYASQVGPAPDAPPTLVGSPLSLSSLEARDAFYGARIGVAFGEPYVTRETLGLADPIDHFRRNAFARPLFFPERR